MSASLAPECNQVKERYDNCFLKWYSEKFLRGTATTDECKPIFEQYEKCLSKALSERGIDKMLKEVRDDNKDNDAEHMKPSVKYKTCHSFGHVLLTATPLLIYSAMSLKHAISLRSVVGLDSNDDYAPKMSNICRTYCHPLSTLTTPQAYKASLPHLHLMVNYISVPVSNMASKIGLGVPMPLLAPATATWAAPFAAYYIFLQNRIVYHRITKKTVMGDKCDESKGASDPLYVASRSQANFAENVPLILAVALLAELNGANRSYLNYALGALFALRVGHVELGLMTEGNAGFGRPVGFLGTQAVLGGLAGYAAYLIKDFWMI